jgi:two-component system sensor histidine kinase GlrK
MMKIKANRVNVLIEDNGPGISEEDRGQIFQPFFQGKQQGQSPVKGSGLGLAISREYVENGGGTIRLLPSSHGARFSLTLPRAAEEAP